MTTSHSQVCLHAQLQVTSMNEYVDSFINDPFCKLSCFVVHQNEKKVIELYLFFSLSYACESQTNFMKCPVHFQWNVWAPRQPPGGHALIDAAKDYTVQ